MFRYSLILKGMLEWQVSKGTIVAGGPEYGETVVKKEWSYKKTRTGQMFDMTPPQETVKKQTVSYGVLYRHLFCTHAL